MTASSEETRVQPVEITCPGCFHPREWDVAGVCPICHYRANNAALLPVGTQLKGYVIGEKLGQGGFGITYRGFDVTLKMKVAIKEYYPSEFVGRSTNRKTVVLNAHEHGELFHYGLRTFLQEAQTIAQLRHPHLVRVVNFFELNDTAYLVMDYYEGEELARHLKPPRKGQPGVQLPWRRAIQLMLPVLNGLQKVHEAGFMHRDIKPGNLYLTRDDELILLDFGSARQVTGTHTRSLLIYSEGFAPYEQYLQGHLNRQGPWTDVYAVAATLYFMLAAHRLPSALDRKQATLLQQPDALKPARHFLPDLPLALDAALLQALAVEPEQRLQSIAVFKQHLETALAEEGKPRLTPPPEPPTQPQVAPKPPIPPKAAPARPVKPRPEAPPPPKVALERSVKPSWRVATVVAIVAVGLIAWGGWSIGLRSPPDFPEPPKVVTPSVVESPPVPAPPSAEPVPTVEPRAYLTVKTEPPGAQVRIMNIGPAYRDGIELVPGDFDIEVSAPGYKTDRAWHNLAAGVQELKIVLSAEPSVASIVPGQYAKIARAEVESQKPASPVVILETERKNQINPLPTAGLIAHYPLDGNGNDVSGNNLHAIVHGATPVAGVIGQALDFNAANDDSLEINGLNSVIRSIAFWIYFDVGNVNNYVLSPQSSRGSKDGSTINWQYNDIDILLGDSDYVFNAFTSLKTGRWYHIAAVDDGTTVKTYLNGVPKKTAAGDNSLVDKDFFVMRHLTPGRGVDGKLDDLRFYNRPLTEAEVAALAQ